MAAGGHGEGFPVDILYSQVSQHTLECLQIVSEQHTHGTPTCQLICAQLFFFKVDCTTSVFETCFVAFCFLLSILGCYFITFFELGLQVAVIL